VRLNKSRGDSATSASFRTKKHAGKIIESRP
jgi:hypothetical protein